MQLKHIAALCGFLLAMAFKPVYSAPMNVPKTLESAIAVAKPGDIVDMGTFPMADVPLLPYEKKGSGPQFVFSDDPEYFRVPEGAGVREKVKPGVVRLYTYHVNATTDSAKRISTVIENLGDKPLNVRFLRFASTGPSKDYYTVGKTGLVDYFSGRSLPKPLVIAPGEGAPLDAKMDAAAVEYDELVHGFYDFEIDQPARITTLQTGLDVPAVVANKRIMEILPPRNPAGAGRGLYQTSTYDVTTPNGTPYDTAQGAMQVLVADGKHDPWITGTDDSNSTICKLAGNYGVIYNIRIPRTSSDGRGVAVLVWYPPAGAQWCDSLALALQAGKGAYPGGTIHIPAKDTAFGGKTNAGMVQFFPPAPEGKEDTIEIVYSPPGASCLPTPLLLIPIDAGTKGE